MAKGTVLRVRVSDTFYQKIKLISRKGKSISDYVRKVLQKDLKETEEEAKKFSELISKIESTDVAKISQKVDLILTTLTGLKILDDVLYYAKRTDIAVEEYAIRRLGRSDFIEDYLNKIKSELKKERSQL